MTLWWLEPEWADARCTNCGAKIAPEGDPDWGRCFSCFGHDLQMQQQEEEYYRQQEEEYQRRALAEEASDAG